MLGLLKICKREQRLRIKMLGRDLKDFLVDIRLYQGLALSPFTIILDEFTNDMYDEIPWWMLFAAYIALIERHSKEPNNMLEK